MKKMAEALQERGGSGKSHTHTHTHKLGTQRRLTQSQMCTLTHGGHTRAVHSAHALAIIHTLKKTQTTTHATMTQMDSD